MTPQNPKQSQPEPRQGRESQPSSSNPQRSGEQTNPQRSGEPSNPQRSGQANPQSTGGPSNPQRTGSPSTPQRTSSQPPRYDDRPQVDREDVQREENEGPAGQSTKSREQRRDESTSGSNKKTGTGGTPSYGDKEPGDPRRSDVEGGKPGREGSESEA